MTENNGNEYASATPVNETPAQPQFKKSFCKYCGNEIQLGSAFCPSCGKPQGNVPVQQMASSAMPQQQQQFYGQPIQQPAPYMAGVYQQPQPTMATNTAQSSQTTVYVQGSRSNGMGTAGFIFALLSIFFFWAPIANFVIWFLGLLFSFIGLFKSPRGLAITGFILSLLGIILIVAVGGMLLAAINS